MHREMLERQRWVLNGLEARLSLDLTYSTVKSPNRIRKQVDHIWHSDNCSLIGRGIHKAERESDVSSFEGVTSALSSCGQESGGPWYQ